MKNEEEVIKYYVLCNRLKDIVRTGWKEWNVKRERVESVAEHIFGVQMLAIAMYSQFKYDIDILKVIMMLAVHELEEIYIGDLTLFDVSKEDKEKMGHEAISKVLEGLIEKEKIEELILEFDAKETKESLFAFYCDKLECDLQCKLYDEEKCVDLSDQATNKSFNDSKVQELLKSQGTWSGMWLLFSQDRYNYDENFMSVSNYAKQNKIKKFSVGGE